MTDEVVDSHIVSENVAEGVIAGKDNIGPDSISSIQEVETVINPTIAISLTEATPTPEVIVSAPVSAGPIPAQQSVESRVNSQHVETLQLQIRLFKTLSQKYLDSSIPKQLDANNRPIIQTVQQAILTAPKIPAQSVQPPAAGSITLLPPPIKPKPVPQAVSAVVPPPRPVAYTPAYTATPVQNVAIDHPPLRPLQIVPNPGPPIVQKIVPEQKIEVKVAEPVVAPTPTIPLSWQCFSSLMFIGPARPPDGMISIAPSVIIIFLIIFFYACLLLVELKVNAFS